MPPREGDGGWPPRGDAGRLRVPPPRGSGLGRGRDRRGLPRFYDGGRLGGPTMTPEEKAARLMELDADYSRMDEIRLRAEAELAEAMGRRKVGGLSSEPTTRLIGEI